MNWKNFEKSFDTILKTWQKNTRERAAFLETLQAEIISKVSLHFKEANSSQEKFCRHIQKYIFFV